MFGTEFTGRLLRGADMNAADRATILIVEDDPATQQSLTTVLGGEWTILVAENGAAAINLAADKLPDLILLDIGWPDMGGFDVCRELKAEPRLAPIPVVFLTNHASAEYEVEGLKVGGVDYIMKPINSSILRARVRNHVELKQSRDALERLARLDGLTGLINRRSFDTAFDREWRRSVRTKQNISVIMMDIDHFKQFNDTYGHGAGDDCLRWIAEAAEGALRRPADLVGRYGGEEFVALLPDTTLEGTMTVAEGIRTAVSSLNIPHSASPVAEYVTISLGVATTVAASSPDPNALIEAADARLYAAKHGGRNRTDGVVVKL